jgi:hypothetical protein
MASMQKILHCGTPIFFRVSLQEQKFVFLTYPLYDKEIVKDGIDPTN